MEWLCCLDLARSGPIAALKLFICLFVPFVSTVAIQSRVRLQFKAAARNVTIEVKSKHHCN